MDNSPETEFPKLENLPPEAHAELQKHGNVINPSEDPSKAEDKKRARQPRASRPSRPPRPARPRPEPRPHRSESRPEQPAFRHFDTPDRDQRVAVSLDIQNLYYGAKDLYDTKIQYDKFLNTIVGKRKLVRSVAYVATRDGNNQGKFIGLLRELGCDVRQKQVIERADGGRKCNLDVEIAIDAIIMASKIDVFILASGDGDFAYLLQALKMNGIRTEVVSFKENTSHTLIEEADSYRDITRDMLMSSDAWVRRDEHRAEGETEKAPAQTVPSNGPSGPTRTSGKGPQGPTRKADTQEDEEAKLECSKCGKPCNSKSGLTLHEKACKG